MNNLFHTHARPRTQEERRELTLVVIMLSGLVIFSIILFLVFVRPPEIIYPDEIQIQQ